MLRHRALHERPEAKQRLLMKRPAAPEPGPSPKHHHLAPLPAKTPMENSVRPDVLPEDPETRALYRQHWQSIRTEETTANRIQDRYNFTLHEMTSSTPVQTADNSFQDQRVFWFYFEKHRDWGTTLLPFQPEQRQIFRDPTSHQERRRLGEIFGRLEPSRHHGVHQTTETRYQMGGPI